jgi:iron only hydrogenase large subunit-like protein
MKIYFLSYHRYVLHSSSSPAITTASVSLADCLACSGCVTSAETVLIQEQSIDKLTSKLDASDSTMVVIISPQSYTDFAIRFNISPAEAFLKLSCMFKSLGVQYVIDATTGGTYCTYTVYWYKTE